MKKAFIITALITALSSGLFPGSFQLATPVQVQVSSITKAAEAVAASNLKKSVDISLAQAQAVRDAEVAAALDAGIEAEEAEAMAEADYIIELNARIDDLKKNEDFAEFRLYDKNLKKDIGRVYISETARRYIRTYTNGEPYADVDGEFNYDSVEVQLNLVIAEQHVDSDIESMAVLTGLIEDGTGFIETPGGSNYLRIGGLLILVFSGIGVLILRLLNKI